jgi:hypothetical protein
MNPSTPELGRRGYRKCLFRYGAAVPSWQRGYLFMVLPHWYRHAGVRLKIDKQ